MRKAATLGLLAAALIPLSLDQPSPSQASERIALPALAETSEIHAKIQSVLFTMARNGEIERSMQRAAKAREQERAARRTREQTASITPGAPASAPISAHDRRRMIEAARSRLNDRQTLAFAGARNAEIRRSLAVYRAARDARTREIAARTSRDLFSSATREAQSLISNARATDEPLWTTLARLAPLIASTSTIEPPAIRIATAKPGIETGSIEQPAAIGPCATPSP